MAKKKKQVVVDSKWLNNVAKLIHDGHSGKYLRLCTGTLQNGPDPVDGVRTMHCGLGELYFQLTGNQPEEDGVNEDDVVDECLNRSALNPEAKREQVEALLTKKLTKELKVLGLSKYVIDDMVCRAAEELGEEIDDKAEEFRSVLNEIPNVNDRTGESTQDEGTCSMGDFKARSKAVAAILREAAELLA